MTCVLKKKHRLKVYRHPKGVRLYCTRDHESVVLAFEPPVIRVFEPRKRRRRLPKELSPTVPPSSTEGP